MRIGILHPGEMGAGVGAALAADGHDVLWASDGRSVATRGRAESAGLRDVGSIAQVIASAQVIVSICPPHAALDVARRAAGFTGLYLDANAIAPTTVTDVARLIESGGGRFLDGGIVGGPPLPGRPTRIYLSGADSAQLAASFAGANFEWRVLSDRPGDASALKAAYAAWTKGTSALLLGIRRFALSQGVEQALVAEWAESHPDLARRALAAANGAGAKGWRWVGEMEEIAKAFETVGLPGGFHAAAADIYRHVPRDPDAAADETTFERVIDALG